MESIEKKVVLSCRIEPDLKEKLTHEAVEEGIALSSYIESLLIHRDSKSTFVDEEEDNSELMAGLQNRIEELEDENTELREHFSKLDTPPQYTGRELELETRVKQLEKEYLNLSHRFKDLMTERDALLKAGSTGLPNWLSTECYNQIVKHLKELKRAHSEYTHEELLLSAVAVALKNDNSLFNVYTLEDFWSRNPHFLNLKQN